MYFFLSAGIGKNLTGIEHAILKRKRVFDNCSLAHKIVTLNFNPNYAENLSLHGIDSGSFLNLYDCFQNLIFAEEKYNGLDQFLSKLSGDIRVEIQEKSGDAKIYINEVYTLYVHFFDNKNISYVNYFDVNRVKFKREIYNKKGYLCKVIYLEKNIQKNVHYIDKKNNLVLEETYNDKELSLMILHCDAKQSFFLNKNELMEFWFQKLVSQYPKSVFYSDKNKLYNETLIRIKSPSFKLISVFHSVHVSNPRQIETGRINSNYQLSLGNKDKFDGFICSTDQQKKDLLERFGRNLQIWVIPPAYSETQDHQGEVILENRFRIISVGRYYVEKRLHHIIEAVELLKEDYPNIQLDLYGFGDARDNFVYEKKIRQYVLDHQLEKNVHFKGYVQNILDHIAEATVSVVTSTLEGFCIGILDSLAVGTPVVAYDIKYGPNEIIEDEYSGYLVEDGDIEALALAIEKTLLNNVMRDNAKESAKKYSLQLNKQKWMNHLLELSNV